MEDEPEAKLEFNKWRLYALFLAGGVNHGNLKYATAEFTWFGKLDPVEPTPVEWKAFGALLDAIRGLPKSAQLKELQQSLTGK